MDALGSRRRAALVRLAARRSCGRRRSASTWSCPSGSTSRTCPTARRWSATRQGVPYAKRAADAYYHDPVGPPLAARHLARRVGAPRRRCSIAGTTPTSTTSRWTRWPPRARKQYEATDRAVVTLWRMHYLQAGMMMRGYDAVPHGPDGRQGPRPRHPGQAAPGLSAPASTPFWRPSATGSTSSS